jgi:salicylate hydroxylase
LFFQNYGKTGQAIWSLGLKIAAGELDKLSPSELKQRALKEVEGWHSPVPELIQETSDSNISSRKYYDKNPLRKARDGRVILLGDAAHPMTPFRGQGANMAMMDALDLAENLRNNPDIDSALVAYEKSMLKRTKRHVLESRNAGFEFHSTNRFKIWKRDTKYRFFNWMLSKIPEQPKTKST